MLNVMKAKKISLLLHPDKIVLRRISKALGDNLMISCLAREIKRTYPRKKVIVETEYPDLFFANPNVDVVLKGKRLPFYVKAKYRLSPDTETHILDQMIRALPFPVSGCERKLDYFEPEDLDLHVLEKLPPDYVVVCPVGKRKFAANRKEWGFDNFQQLVHLLADIPVVQIGSPSDPLLHGVIDFRSVGFPIQICAAVIRHSLTGIFTEGGFMHLANAVGKPAVIVYGGALRPESTGYDLNVNLSQEVDCGPCFTSHRPLTECPTMKCMRPISPELVARSVMNLIHHSL